MEGTALGIKGYGFSSFLVTNRFLIPRINHFKKYCRTDVRNPKTALFIETVFTDLQSIGEDGVLNKKYMKETYERICLGK